MAEAQADPDHGIMPHTRRLLVGKSVGLVALIAMLCTGIGGATSRDEAAASTLNVRTYGAVGDGRHDDTAALVRATRAAVAKHATLWVPRGTYRLSSISLPDGLTMRGVGRGSWLKGEVVFGSCSRLSGLKLGDAGTSTHNRRGASYTTFTACRFRGGGGSDVNAPVIMLGLRQNSCDHITFTDCNVERNLGSENSSFTLYYNNISLMEDGDSVNGSHIDHITFDGCHVGVSNGRTDIARNIGSPRAGIECYTANTGGYAYHGFGNITLTNCIFEATDSFCVDFSDNPLVSDHSQRASGPVTVQGCTLMGGGYGGGSFGYTLCIESPKGVLIENNTIYRGYSHTVKYSFSSGTVSGAIMRNNVIDMAFDNGITPPPPSSYAGMVCLSGTGNSFTGNTLTTNAGGQVLELQEFVNGTVTGNTLIEQRTSNAPWALNIWDSSGNTITGNTLKTAGTSNPDVHYQGANSNNTVESNIFQHN